MHCLGVPIFMHSIDFAASSGIRSSEASRSISCVCEHRLVAYLPTYAIDIELHKRRSSLLSTERGHNFLRDDSLSLAPTTEPAEDELEQTRPLNFRSEPIDSIS